MFIRRVISTVGISAAVTAERTALTAERILSSERVVAYAKTQESLGNSGYAMNVRNYLREGLTQKED